MQLALQVKLLRVLQERRLERLGGNEAIVIDCRFIAASKADLLRLSAQGAFREDLYYRIGVLSIDLPRLVERREDIPMLLAHFAQGAAIRYQRPVPQWSAAQMAQWQARDWPGNVRELHNFSDRLVLGVMDGWPDGSHADTSAATDGSALPQQVDAYERMLIADALAATDNNVAAAADRLGYQKRRCTTKSRNTNLQPGAVPNDE